MNDSVRRSRWICFWSIALCGASFDLVTKEIVFQRIGYPSRPVPIIANILELHTSYNKGALWGFGRDVPHSSLIFAGLSVVAALAIIYWLFVRGACRDLKLTTALGLIMAGALGNCFDRLVHHQVRDFVHFHVDAINFDCAIFNFADNMLVIGAVALMMLAMRSEPVGEPKAEAHPTSA